eukprot:scaffold7082_cov234-Pinguiococcus_pyrenoidosus.AAC.1
MSDPPRRESESPATSLTRAPSPFEDTPPEISIAPLGDSDGGEARRTSPELPAELKPLARTSSPPDALGSSVRPACIRTLAPRPFALKPATSSTPPPDTTPPPP